MKSKQLLFLLIFAFSALLMASVPIGSVTAAESSDPQVLRVGYFSFSGYHDIDDSTQKRSGYGYEFLQMVAKHTDWQYVYEGYDKSYAECLDMLERGELDIVTSVSKTAEREEKFLFSEKNIGTAATIFTVKAGNQKVEKGNYDTYNNLKVGRIEGNSKNDIFEQFAADNGFECDYIDFETEAELSEALQNGTVDGIVSGSLRAMGNEWLLETLSPQPFYICVDKDRSDLMDKINVAIDEIDLQEPDWRNILHDKYYSTDKNGAILLNSEEREYLSSLANDEELSVIMNPDRAPYSYFENGEAKGIFPALFKAMTKNLDLHFKYIPVRDRAEYYELRNAGNVDIVLDLSDDLFIAEHDGYKITDTYYTTTHTMIKRRNLNHALSKFATISYVDNSYSNYLEKYVGDNTEPLTYSSLKECIDAVKSGECDATITLSYVAEVFIWQDERNELISELIGEASSNYALGVNSKKGHILLSILNKCVAAFDDGTASAIVTEEVTKFRPTPESELFSLLKRNPIYIALIVASVLLLLFVIAMLVVRTLNQRKLQRKVTEATSKLQAQTEELSVALHAADAANRSKTTFLNNMSHDIRTPMNAIIGFTALATTHIDNKQRALDYLSKISQASNHLLSLINDVLDMSRIESGKVHIDDRPENLADILQGLRNIIQADIHSKHLDLFIDTVDVTNEEVYCDKLRLNQILLNLTSNAIKFTESGGSVHIKVTQKHSEKEGYGSYEFTVSDTGIGMSPEFAKTVFDPFTRERNSTVSGIQGTGLGMAITKNIVDIMGGTITVESEQGKGTTFTVTLELKFAEEGERVELTELKGLYALVVDDDLISCQSVSKMLRNIGMNAEWTATGKEAVIRTSEAIELGRPFEVYIIDWAMPDMDGIATVKQIREIIGDESPIILMSAYDWADIEQEARDAGVTGFVSKPLFASDLHRALENSLGRPAAEESSSKTSHSFVGKHILLVEDNELNREIAGEILSEAGFEVEFAENGKIACQMVENSQPNHFDLVLMDVQMPVMNGYEATKHIRALQDKTLANVPIIAMTANAFDEDKSDAFAAGMNGHLAKPINIEEMLVMLEHILDDKNKE